MIKSNCEVLIVGGGPSGLALAARLKKEFALKIRILEREGTAGGIPRHSNHLGYGIRDLHKFMSGPKYAKYYVDMVNKSKIELSLNASAWDWSADKTLLVSSPKGVEEISAEKIILATGARERSRNARVIPGSRPEGIYTTGSLQQSVYLKHSYVGSKAVIIGTEHVSYSALITLKHAGVKTIAMIEPELKIKSFQSVSTATNLFFGYKLFTDTKIIKINGNKRVSSLTIENKFGHQDIECDTLIFTGNWIPDNELARRGNIEFDLETKSPIVNANFETSRRGIYAIGNLLLPIKSADQCVIETRKFLFN